MIKLTVNNEGVFYPEIPKVKRFLLKKLPLQEMLSHAYFVDWIALKWSDYHSEEFFPYVLNSASKSVRKFVYEATYSGNTQRLLIFNPQTRPDAFFDVFFKSKEFRNSPELYKQIVSDFDKEMILFLCEQIVRKGGYFNPEILKYMLDIQKDKKPFLERLRYLNIQLAKMYWER